MEQSLNFGAVELDIISSAFDLSDWFEQPPTMDCEARGAELKRAAHIAMAGLGWQNILGGNFNYCRGAK